jgi:membrane protease YdiL (CAAX protease family)
LATPPNPPLESEPQILPPAEFLPTPSHIEDPPWTGWSVLWITLFGVLSIAVLGTVTVFVVQKMFYPHSALGVVAEYPLVAITAQVVVYIALFLFMVSVLTWRGLPFWRSVRWTWPRNPYAYLLGGIALSLALQAVAHFLPMPKELPMDKFFQTERQAWVLAIFGTTLAPLMEELFFRGFLYPALARRTGVAISVFITSLAFSLIHAPQLGRAWGPVLVIFLVGLTFTIVRVVTKSVATGFLMHVAYNGTLSILLYIATDRFHHLERINQ